MLGSGGGSVGGGEIEEDVNDIDPDPGLGRGPWNSRIKG